LRLEGSMRQPGRRRASKLRSLVHFVHLAPVAKRISLVIRVAYGVWKRVRSHSDGRRNRLNGDTIGTLRHVSGGVVALGVRAFTAGRRGG